MTEPMVPIAIRDFLLWFGIIAAASVAAAIGLLILAFFQISNTVVPEDADFFETMQAIPITIPLALDLLDLAFDVFAAPIAWLLLDFLGLPALRTVTVIEGFIPGTQLLPTLTLAWLFSRIMKKKPKGEMQKAMGDYEREDRLARRAQLRSGRADLVDQYRRQALPVPELGGGDAYQDDMDEWEQNRRYEDDPYAPLDVIDVDEYEEFD